MIRMKLSSLGVASSVRYDDDDDDDDDVNGDEVDDMNIFAAAAVIDAVVRWKVVVAAAPVDVSVWLHGHHDDHEPNIFSIVHNIFVSAQ